MSKGIHIILYPRSYNKRGEETLHSAFGVTPEGKEINIKLRLSPEYQRLENAPSIAEFSREDRKAMQACIAGEDNGPDSREGVLLFSQALPDGTNRKGADSYVAKWAVVLAEDAQSPEPLIAHGRLDINKNAPAIKKLRKTLDEAIAQGAGTEEIADIEEQLQDGRNYSYHAVLYYPQKMKTLPCEKESVIDALAEVLDEYSTKGVIGGAMIRKVDASGRVFKRQCQEIYARYVVSKRRYQTGREVAEQFFEDNQDAWLSGFDNKVEIIPMSRINGGPRASSYYGSEDRFKTIQRLYFGKNGQPRLCRVAVRVTEYNDTNNTLLSKIYNISEPLGPPERLDGDGTFKRIFVGEADNDVLASIKQEEGNEQSVGITQNTSFMMLAPWYAKEKIAGYTLPVKQEQFTYSEPDSAPSILSDSDTSDNSSENIETNETIDIDGKDPVDTNEDQESTDHIEKDIDDQKDEAIDDEEEQLENKVIIDLKNDLLSRINELSDDIPTLPDFSLFESEIINEASGPVKPDEKEPQAPDIDSKPGAAVSEIAETKVSESTESQEKPLDITAEYIKAEIKVIEKEKKSELILNDSEEKAPAPNKPTAKLTGMAAFINKKNG